MDPIIETSIEELMNEIRQTGANLNDPVAKIMVTALLHQAQKIKDRISMLPEQVADRLCDYFIPKNKIGAVPALCLLNPKVKLKKSVEAADIAPGTFFSFKIDNRTSLTFHPLFNNYMLPLSATHLLMDKLLLSNGARTKLNLNCKGKVWLGLEMPSEIETLENVSFYISNTGGVSPKQILVGNELRELSFTEASDFGSVPMMEPFDSQQIDSSSIEYFSIWKRQLMERDGGILIYVNDGLRDRDVFKLKPYPKSFQLYLESNDLDRFENNTFWILFDFGSEYDVPENIAIIPNVVPAVNVSINTANLTPTTPIVRLTKGDDSFFLNVIETSLPSQRQGFSKVSEEVVIRDFDTKCYDSGLLHRDVRNLYNRFVEDYHAFVDFHSLKDGEMIRNLRELVNKIGKSVMSGEGIKNYFDEGTYAMRNIGLSGKPATVKVSYLTTNGRLGNSPKAGMKMENKKDLALEKEVMVLTDAEGGEDMATPDMRYELLRYYTLTSDRLFTKMDVDAFLRLQLLKEFGKEEVKRIRHEISIHGAGGEAGLVRGLYIDISFKDTKNYQKAMEMNLDRKLHRMIVDRSCISMPIIITLINSEIE